MATVTFEINDDLKAKLEERLGKGSLGKFAAAAFNEWAEWLLAIDRPMTIPDIETSRVLTLYTSILVDAQPSASHLMDLLQLPLGRCRYLLQCLRYQYPDLIRERLLRSILQTCSKLTKDGDWYKLDVEPDCSDVLNTVLARLVDSKQIGSEVEHKRWGGKVRYKLGDTHYEALLAALEQELAGNVKGGAK